MRAILAVVALAGAVSASRRSPLVGRAHTVTTSSTTCSTASTSTATSSTTSGVSSSTSSVSRTPFDTSTPVISPSADKSTSFQTTKSAESSSTSSSSSLSSSTSTGCSTVTTSTATCVPCEGQPDSDPDNFCGLTVDTNYYNEAPITCRTVEYDFTISNITISPDGVPRYGLVVNGQMPGPTLEANWGDEVVIHIHNDLPYSADNGTTIHWHGIRQNYTNEMDGTPSIVQCPITPGHSHKSKWRATEYGTSWYHSHFALQAWEGIVGPIVINGPASASYDDEAVVFLQDWSHATVDQLYDEAQYVSENTDRSNPTMDDGLINGLNIWTDPATGAQTGSRYVLDVTKGQSYRLRVINAAIAATFVFSVDSHTLTVIAADFVPVTPFKVKTIPINIGQRYDLLLKADQAVDNYWMRSDNQQECSPMIAWNETLAIVRYAGAADADPTSTEHNYTATCGDVALASLVPVVAISAGTVTQSINESVVIAEDPSDTALYKWLLSGTTFQSEWGDPTLLSIVENGTIPDYSGSLAISAPNLGEWVYVIIESVIPVAHPIHLHGHDFLILAQGAGTYSSSVILNTVNPARRDTAMMPADPESDEGSYLVVAFYTNNPGVWLMHCHIGWHVSMGFALQIIEAQDEIAATVTESCNLQEQCDVWNSYASRRDIVVDDSGV